MKLLLLILFTAVYIWIAWQDLKSRNVFVISFIVAYIITGLWMYQYKPADWNNILINIAILGFMSSCTGIYYILRYRKIFLTKLRHSIGLGDIVIIPVFIFYFSPSFFLYFLIVSFIFSLFYWGIVKALVRKEGTIPLAGIQSLLMVFFVWCEFFLLNN